MRGSTPEYHKERGHSCPPEPRVILLRGLRRLALDGRGMFSRGATG